MPLTKLPTLPRSRLAETARPIFEDDFERPDLDRGKWFPYYLPQWSSRDLSAARYIITEGRLRLFVAPDQQPWCPEFDGEVRVSGLQTGHFSGPLASDLGQHRFRPDLVVREEMPAERLFLPRYCRLEMRARALLNPWNLAALWLIGYEDRPEESGEITVFEAFGNKAYPSACEINRGIKKVNDTSLRDQIDGGRLNIDVRNWHVYAMDWTKSGIDFFVDGELVTRVDQSPDYPMQLMLNFYDLATHPERDASREGWFDIDYIRAFPSSNDIPRQRTAPRAH